MLYYSQNTGPSHMYLMTPGAEANGKCHHAKLLIGEYAYYVDCNLFQPPFGLQL